MISATMIADSTSWLGVRLSTMVLNYPRCIHADLMTHRVFSRNAASSRAIPYKTLRQRIYTENFIPFWSKNQSGMQGKLIEDLKLIEQCDKLWEDVRDAVVFKADLLSDLEVHKQNVNRLLEPFQYIQVLVTSTEWSNFLALRDHEAAQPEIQILARRIQECLFNSQPQELKVGQWHLPFVDTIADNIYSGYKFYPSDSYLLEKSVARCARISYNKHNADIHDYIKDIELHNRLVGSNPKHLSPTEHQCRVPSEEELDMFKCEWVKKLNGGDPKWIYSQGAYHSNLIGWIQYRKFIENDIKVTV